MTIQTVFFIFGIILVVAAVGLGIAAAVYFQRMDIRSVQADLSGKAKQAGIASINFASAQTKNKKGALAKDPVWQGGIAKGDLKKSRTARNTTSASEAVESKALRTETATGSAANGSPSARRDAKAAGSADVSETQVSETRAAVAAQEKNEQIAQAEKASDAKAVHAQAEAKAGEVSETQVNEADDAAKVEPSRSFRIERSVVRLGSSMVLDEEGKLKEVDSAGRAVER